jgi:hypothetical protein
MVEFRSGNCRFIDRLAATNKSTIENYQIENPSQPYPAYLPYLPYLPYGSANACRPFETCTTMYCLPWCW